MPSYHRWYALSHARYARRVQRLPTPLFRCSESCGLLWGRSMSEVREAASRTASKGKTFCRTNKKGFRRKESMSL